MTDRFPLRLLPEAMAVCRLPPGARVPAWADGPPFSCVMRTAEELSIVCAESRVPAGVQAERGFRAFQLVGPVPFTTVGVVSGMTAPLAAAGVSVFVLSTYDTDYLLVKGRQLAQARPLLESAGFPLLAPP